MSQGWDTSAQAWINTVGEFGDWGRRYVLDSPMLARVAQGQYQQALDLGCGEGRFCRMLAERGIPTIGIDPTAALIDHAIRLDPTGDYRVAQAEALPIDSASMDLVVAYLSLIDIDDLPRAILEAHRVLRPEGRFLIANSQSFNTAATPQGWTYETDGSRRFCIDNYLTERKIDVAWNGIRVHNWHRPLQVYMQLLLNTGFTLCHFSEPEPIGIDDAKADRYRRAPNFLMMEWKKA